MIGTNRIRKGVGVLALGVGLAFLGGCTAVDNLLKVSNPSQLQEASADDPALADILVNSVAGAMVSTIDDPFIWRGSMFTDQQVTGINWEQTARLNERIVNFRQPAP